MFLINDIKLTRLFQFDSMKGIVDTRVGSPTPVVAQGIVHHSMGEAGLTIVAQEDITQVLGCDELVPVVRAPGQQTNHVLGPHDGHQPGQLRLGEGREEQGAVGLAQGDTLGHKQLLK